MVLVCRPQVPAGVLGIRAPRGGQTRVRRQKDAPAVDAGAAPAGASAATRPVPVTEAVARGAAARARQRGSYHQCSLIAADGCGRAAATGGAANAAAERQAEGQRAASGAESGGGDAAATAASSAPRASHCREPPPNGWPPVPLGAGPRARRERREHSARGDLLASARRRRECRDGAYAPLTAERRARRSRRLRRSADAKFI